MKVEILLKAPESFERVVRGEIKGDQLQEYNSNAFKDFNEKALLECPNCSRTFLPRPLEIHLRSCKPKAESPDQQGKRQAEKKYKPPRLKKKVDGPGKGAFRYDVHKIVILFHPLLPPVRIWM